jgi:DNA-binding SARP family transcriptional activator
MAQAESGGLSLGADVERPELEPASAAELAHVAFHRGEFREVLELSSRTRFSRDGTADEIVLLAFVATAHRMMGDLASCRRATTRAAAAAHRSDSPHARAAVHQVTAMVAEAEGDRRQAEAKYRMALANADAADDPLQLLWIRLCRARRILDMGDPRVALADSETLLRLAESSKAPYLTAHALTTCGRANLRLGELEPARTSLCAAIDIFERLGSRFLAWPLCGLGDLHQVRGQLARARAAYEEALTLAEPTHDVLGLGSALIGLAQVRVADDIAEARAFADRAVDLREALHQVQALLTRGWVELLSGNRQAAAVDASRAGTAARLRRDDPRLAEAMMLTAMASGPAADPALLREALSIWRDTGCRIEAAAVPIVADRIGISLPRVGDGGYQALETLGVDIFSQRSAAPLGVIARYAPSISIRALGVFQVSRDRTPVPKTEWRSKKARDLLKILVAHRRPVSRDRLMELLWPEEDAGKASKRLSVLLSTLKAVFESAGRLPDEGGLVADRDVVWLDLAHIDIDVEDFLKSAGRALRADAEGADEAIARLAAADALYAGDFLEDEPHEEWASPLREEARTLHMAVLRALAARTRAAGDTDRAVLSALRLLAHDPYDEEAHLGLVGDLIARRRPGEARRRYERYVSSMAELGAAPAPFPNQSPTRGGGAEDVRSSGGVHWSPLKGLIL